MDRTIIQSSKLLSVGYDYNTETLEVEFQDGKVNQYVGVPELLYNRLMKSKSKGEFLHKNIQDSFLIK